VGIFKKKGKTKLTYSLIAKIFHWGTVAIFAYGVFTQVDGDVIQLENVSLLYSEITFAAVFLVILAMRFIYMNRTQTTSLPTKTPKWQKQAAKLVHLAMYASLASIALSGLAVAIVFHLGFKTGLIIEIAVELHELTISSSYWLIIAHIFAALYHRMLGDGVWSSMTPFWKEKSRSEI